MLNGFEGVTRYRMKARFCRATEVLTIGNLADVDTPKYSGVLNNSGNRYVGYCGTLTRSFRYRISPGTASPPGAECWKIPPKYRIARVFLLFTRQLGKVNNTYEYLSSAFTKQQWDNECPRYTVRYVRLQKT